MDINFIENCKKLLSAYKNGNLGQTKMPEDSNPGFSQEKIENRLCYFTLPMALNYQRNSYTLRESVLKTYNDIETRDIFDIKNSYNMNEELLRNKLMKYKIALQPNKHIQTRKKISETIYKNRGSIENLLKSTNNDFLKLKLTIQKDYKSGFPYLSGPKIFNYRSFIIQEYGKIKLKNSEFIDIAPDTHITKCSIKLGVITEKESTTLTKDEISARRRKALKGSGITPITMHAPLRFRSKNNFIFKL